MARTKWTPRAEEKFFEVLEKTRNVTAACRSAKVSHSSAYKRRDEDPAFRDKWAEHWDSFKDDLHGSLLTRAIDGWLEPVFYQGEIVGEIRKFDNRLGFSMLERLMPEIYGATARVSFGDNDMLIEIGSKEEEQ